MASRYENRLRHIEQAADAAAGVAVCVVDSHEGVTRYRSGEHAWSQAEGEGASTFAERVRQALGAGALIAVAESDLAVL